MSVIGSNILAGASGQGGDYTINRSLRFRNSASAFLSRTPSASNRKTWTWSAWVKRSNISANGLLFGARTGGGGTYFNLSFQSAGDLRIESNLETAYPLYKTNALFRDPSAWYHIVVALDMTQATSTNRLKVYVNGVLQTTASFNVPAQNTDLAINSTETHLMGQQASGSYLDGYMTEVNFIDGQALTPSSFGANSASTGVWQPKKYAGTYGTNGFYLPFTNNASTTTLGNDFSGNGNNWTTNNISLTAGSTYDSMTDVPTLTSATAANYCVFNPLDRGSTNFTLSNGNLNIVGASASSAVRATMAVSSGKWYWEATPTAIGNGLGVGFAGDSSRFNVATWNAGTYVIYQSDGNKHINGSASSYGASYTTSDVIGIALDMDAGTITFYKNNTSQGTASTGLTGVYLPVFAQTSGATTGTINANFGAGSGFAYTPPTGFVALNTFNLPTPTIGATASTQAGKFMNTVTYTGNGASSRAITGVGFQPDLVWTKSRSGANPNVWIDSNRGLSKFLISNSSNAEGTDATLITSFDSDGFTIGTDNPDYNNFNGDTYVAWNWRANQGTNVSNTAGSITSTVSANTSSGFSVVTYTGTGANATVGHGLGAVPSMYIVKRRNAGGDNWATYHISVGNTKFLRLDTTGTPTTFNLWQNTTPSSSVFYLTSDVGVNGSGSTYVAYCFSEVAGYSKFGSYTGNDSADGVFVYTGFRPAFLLIKNSGATQPWVLIDTKRSPYNVSANKLYPNASDAENSTTTDNSLDILSNGFKLRGDAATNDATNGLNTMIYMAFAENPFKYSLAR